MIELTIVAVEPVEEGMEQQREDVESREVRCPYLAICLP
jgi:hypothetical protein